MNHIVRITANFLSAKPNLICFSDPRINIEQILIYMPSGSMIILRDKINIDLIKKIKSKNLLVSIKANHQSPKYAEFADGIHLQGNINFINYYQERYPDKIITASFHNADRHEKGFYSPIFKTRSHADRKPIGKLQFMKSKNKYLLGGINDQNCQILRNCDSLGLAGIDLFIPEIEKNN